VANSEMKNVTEWLYVTVVKLQTKWCIRDQGDQIGPLSNSWATFNSGFFSPSVNNIKLDASFPT
jgi:hypothetical protein